MTSILNQVHHNTLSYVSSQTDSLIGTIAFTGILVMAAVLGLAGRVYELKISLKRRHCSIHFGPAITRDQQAY